jgi:hypothetical protein
MKELWCSMSFVAPPPRSNGTPPEIEELVREMTRLAVRESEATT